MHACIHRGEVTRVRARGRVMPRRGLLTALLSHDARTRVRIRARVRVRVRLVHQ